MKEPEVKVEHKLIRLSHGLGIETVVIVPGVREFARFFVPGYPVEYWSAPDTRNPRHLISFDVLPDYAVDAFDTEDQEYRLMLVQLRILS